MIEISAPQIEVSFNVLKEKYKLWFRPFWFGYVRGKGIKNWTPSENGNYTNITLTVDVNTAKDIYLVLQEQYFSGTDIDFVDIRRLREILEKIEKTE